MIVVSWICENEWGEKILAAKATKMYIEHEAKWKKKKEREKNFIFRKS